MKVTNYDKYNYDYSTYWKGREYENLAEEVTLKRMFKTMRGVFFLDVGGSFGRNHYLYKNQYSTPIIADYSFNTLKANYKKIKLPKQKFLIYPAPLNFSLGVHLTPNMNNEYVKVGPSVDLNLIDIFRTTNFNSRYKFQMLIDYFNSSMLLGSLKMYSINKDFCFDDLLNLLKIEINQTLIRSPLINIKEGKFETDFIIENSKRSCHLLNIQSPGWTSSLALVNHLFKNKIIPF